MLRPASLSDAPFVAQGLAMGLHLDPTPEDLLQIAEVCRRPDTLYSVRHAIIATVDDRPAGVCLAYDGRGYHDIRLRTFALFPNKAEEMDFEHFEDETGEGEFYIDTLAVLPEFRRRGIGSALMTAQIDRGRAAGLPIATLLVDPDNPPALRLYERLGFKYHSTVYAFGQDYEKWALLL